MTISYYGNNLYYTILIKAVGFEVFFAHYNYQALLEFCSSSNLLLSEHLGIFTRLLAVLSVKFSHYFRVVHGDYALSS